MRFHANICDWCVYNSDIPRLRPHISVLFAVHIFGIKTREKILLHATKKCRFFCMRGKVKITACLRECKNLQIFLCVNKCKKPLMWKCRVISAHADRAGVNSQSWHRSGRPRLLLCFLLDCTILVLYSAEEVWKKIFRRKNFFFKC